MQMTLLEAIKARHSVRQYIDEPLEHDVANALKEKIKEINKLGNLHIQLVLNEPKAFSKGLAYGTFKGVSNYLVMAGPKGKDLEERIGFFGQQLVLYAQTLGVNSCWAGLTYKQIAGTYTLGDNEKMVCYIALGYGKTQGHKRKSKTVQEVSNASSDTPRWFVNGVEAALLAPTAINQQKFYFEYLGEPENPGPARVAAKRGFSLVGYTKIDLGIAKFNFEIGAARAIEWV